MTMIVFDIKQKREMTTLQCDEVQGQTTATVLRCLLFTGCCLQMLTLTQVHRSTQTWAQPRRLGAFVGNTQTSMWVLFFGRTLFSDEKLVMMNPLCTHSTNSTYTQHTHTHTGSAFAPGHLGMISRVNASC